MPRRNKPNTRARDRTARALEMRLAGRSNGDIAAELGYASEAGARMAIDRELNRRTAAGVDMLRREHGQRLQALLSACWDKALSGDTDAIRTAKQLMDSISKLHGLDAAVQQDLRPGISESEFAQAAVEFIQVINGSYGPGSPAARAVAHRVPGIAEQMSPAMRADLFTPEAIEVQDDDEWCNIGSKSVSGPLTPATQNPMTPGSDDPSVSDRDPATDVSDTSADGPATGEAQADAKVVLPPPPQPRGIIDHLGEPFGRSGYALRLGGYDPLAHWRP